jgi:uncharacterized protein YbjT (DUF2867 family)
MNILVLGGNGFIGGELARAFLAGGHGVACLGRNVAGAATRLPHVRWIGADLATLTEPSRWLPLLEGVDCVINAAGALQDSYRDRLDEVQHRAMAALYGAALSRRLRIVQISADTGGAGADTPFLATKRMADVALRQSGLPHTILRPALVIGRNAHGGTALIRALAALPLAVPLVMANSPVRTADMADLCQLALDAAQGKLGEAADISLASADDLTLRELVLLHRRWLGLKPARVIEMPAIFGRVIAGFADLAGALGWRSPLRSTALTVLSGGIAAPAGSQPRLSRPAGDVLAAHPSGVHDLWFARLYLLKPAVLLCLSAFWLASGVMALVTLDEAASWLQRSGVSRGSAVALAVAAALVDCSLGLAILWRNFARQALVAMTALALFYLLAASLFAPGLWLDPLGPLVKIVPAILLAILALAILEER